MDIDCYNPRCSCFAWIKSELPCKHIFTIIEHTYITWEDLPESFCNHPLFNLDEDILGFSEADFALPPDSEEFDPQIIEELRNATLDEVGSEVQEEVESLLESHTSTVDDPGMKIENIQFKVREQCQLIKVFSYNFVNPHVAKSFLDELSELYTKYYDELAGSGGVIELSQEQKKFKPIRSYAKQKNTQGTPMMYKGKVVIPLFKPSSKKCFKRTNAKPLDLEKEIGDLPLS